MGTIAVGYSFVNSGENAKVCSEIELFFVLHHLCKFNPQCISSVCVYFPQKSNMPENLPLFGSFLSFLCLFTPISIDFVKSASVSF